MTSGHLPVPVIENWEWQLDGACRDADPTTFFHTENERGARRRRREANAKAVCAQCPVLQQCRSFALESREPFGIWGGLGEGDREAIWAAQDAAAKQQVAAVAA